MWDLQTVKAAMKANLHPAVEPFSKGLWILTSQAEIFPRGINKVPYMMVHLAMYKHTDKYFVYI